MGQMAATAEECQWLRTLAVDRGQGIGILTLGDAMLTQHYRSGRRPWFEYGTVA
jgi:hypothetical protein